MESNLGFGDLLQNFNVTGANHSSYKCLHRFSDKLKIEVFRAALKTSSTELELPQKEKAFSVGFHFSGRNTFRILF
ncbi:hypothetical protein EDS67_26845 [candidate division KSB1 bacterium]|nr:MAG: hypothetical protein EDS67_26845 [candidate division KSB1 bacterium]MBC6948949.1 hypothetical protein [candidate division KSB1 bacterium]MCE7945175.1 hypothetical protein [Chlorobi bacterium CHB1]RIK74098.1 MAG: hypothetical protein DCC62_16015 [candidate division KSB1 bacterium]